MCDQALKRIDVLLVTFLKLTLHLENHALDSPLLILAQLTRDPCALPRGIYLCLHAGLLSCLLGHLPLAVPADHYQVPLDLVRPRLLLPGDLHALGVKLREGRVHLDTELPVKGESLPAKEGVLLESQLLGVGRMLGKESGSGELGGVLSRQVR